MEVEENINEDLKDFLSEIKKSVDDVKEAQQIGIPRLAPVLPWEDFIEH